MAENAPTPSEEKIRLTSLSRCAGWASKLNAETLAQVLRPIQGIFDSADSPDLLVGLGDPDDAAVWRLDETRALVVTTDFFTPVVDDPYPYGAIAAANSLSDVYAMGGQPFLALNIAAFPARLPPSILTEIFRGGAEKAKEAGVVIAGGHTIQDDEPKYGLIVIGFVDPAKSLTKGGARVGDKLVLTKPLGIGVTTTAIKSQLTTPEEANEAITSMMRLNDRAAQLAREFELRGGTDVTGFSLLGHGMEVAETSGVRLRVAFEQVPFISAARRLAEEWAFAGGAFDNQNYFGRKVTFTTQIDESLQMLLFDPQTSGGLLLAVPEDKLDAFQQRAQELEQPAWVIGDVVEGEGIEVV